ncbi:MAG: hypothetical protein ACE3NC_08570 [Candidatus Wallacebacter cryptica]|nr:hypothetical protein [Bacillota bacterium]
MWLDRDRTLILDRNRDTWQLPLVDCSGDYVGQVVGQIVEPKACMVRYFLVYDPESERRFPLPSDLVVQIGDEIHCQISPQQIARLPEYKQQLEREHEILIYQIIDRIPYWEESLQP